MVIVVLRIVWGVWFLGVAALLVLALADTLFGRAPFGERLRALPLRCVVAVIWPLAALTPRGREFLKAQWRTVL